MDNGPSPKKYFDVTPPPQPTAPLTAPLVTSGRQMIAVESPTPLVAEDPLLSATSTARINKIGATIAPPTLSAQTVLEAEEPIPTDEPVVTDEQQKTPEVVPVPSAPGESLQVEEAPKLESPTYTKEPQATADALPDPSETAANSLKETMQEPKIYDTTVYHVPIKNAGHGHGGIKMAFTVGALFAVVVVVGAVYLMVRLGS